MKSAFKTIVLTRKCNQSCDFCSIVHQAEIEKSASTKADYQDFTPDEVVALAKEFMFQEVENARNKRYPILWLSGGEPTVYPHFQQVYQRLQDFLKTEYPEYGIVGVCTNGSATVNFYRRVFQSSWPTLIHTSLHGMREAHNRITGFSKSFESSEAFISELCQHEENRFVVLQSCLTSANCSSKSFFQFLLQRALQLLRAKKAVCIQLTAPEGRVLEFLPGKRSCQYATFYELRNALSLFFEAVAEVSDELLSASWYSLQDDAELTTQTTQLSSYEFQVMFQGYPRCVFPIELQDPSFIGSSGDTTEVRFLLDAPSASGNLYKHNITETQKEKFQLLERASNYFQYTDDCIYCPHRQICSGFMKESALFTTTLRDVDLASEIRQIRAKYPLLM